MTIIPKVWNKRFFTLRMSNIIAVPVRNPINNVKYPPVTIPPAICPPK